jgi:hypothetical protein
MKIDIEGDELASLRGMNSKLPHVPIEMNLLEFNPA